jgi:Luciferase-like monooxygenase
MCPEDWSFQRSLSAQTGTSIPISGMLERPRRLDLSMLCHRYGSWQAMARITNTNLSHSLKRFSILHRSSMSSLPFFLAPGIPLSQPSKLRVLINIPMGKENGTWWWRMLICSSRISVNIVSGWFKQEFTSIGQWWLDHGERYRRSREFITCLKGIWTQDQFSFKGDFYQVWLTASTKCPF